jgi:hypothetical protein
MTDASTLWPAEQLRPARRHSKTTLLVHWLQGDARPLTWLTLECWYAAAWARSTGPLDGA